MTFKSLLFSFLGIGAVTSTVIGGYCIFSPDKSDTTKSSDKDADSKTEEGQLITPPQQVVPQITLEETPRTLASTQKREDAVANNLPRRGANNTGLAPDSPKR